MPPTLHQVLQIADKHINYLKKFVSDFYLYENEHLLQMDPCSMSISRPEIQRQSWA